MPQFTENNTLYLNLDTKKEPEPNPRLVAFGTSNKLVKCGNRHFSEGSIYIYIYNDYPQDPTMDIAWVVGLA